jgi:hypothetical protein|tara:strand:+ start:53 stop:586 length:534 start_codon:yes stop_codon:yes gene_type:complete
MAASNLVPDNLNYLSNISFRLTMQDAPNLTWFCQAVNVPGVSIEGIDVFTPYVTIPYAGNKVSFEELSVRFIVDEHMKNWTEIYDRIIALGLTEGSEKYRLLKAKSDATQRGGTVSTIVLTILTSAMNPQMEFHFYEAFPISISALDFDSANTDVEYFTATAGFRYTNYEIKNLLNN